MKKMIPMFLLSSLLLTACGQKGTPKKLLPEMLRANMTTQEQKLFTISDIKFQSFIVAKSSNGIENNFEQNAESPEEYDGMRSYLQYSAGVVAQSYYETKWNYQDVWENTRQLPSFAIKDQLKNEAELKKILESKGEINFLKSFLKASFVIDSNFSFDKNPLTTSLYYQDSAHNLIKVGTITASDKNKKNITLAQNAPTEGEVSFSPQSKASFFALFDSTKKFFLRFENLKNLSGDENDPRPKLLVLDENLQKFSIPQGMRLIDFINEKIGNVSFGGSINDIEAVGDKKSTLQFGKKVSDLESSDVSLGRWVFLSPDGDINSSASNQKTYALVFMTGENMIGSFQKSFEFKNPNFTHGDTNASMSLGKLSAGDQIKISFTGDISFHQPYEEKKGIHFQGRHGLCVCVAYYFIDKIVNEELPFYDDLNEYRISILVGGKKFILKNDQTYISKNLLGSIEVASRINLNGNTFSERNENAEIILEARDVGRKDIGFSSIDPPLCREGDRSKSTVPSQKFFKYNINAEVTRFGVAE